MSKNINTNFIESYKEKVIVAALKVHSNLKDWSKWEHNGRIYVGYKRINFEPFLNVYGRYKFKPLSAIEIARRKVRVWLDKRK